MLQGPTCVRFAGGAFAASLVPEHQSHGAGYFVLPGLRSMERLVQTLPICFALAKGLALDA